MHIRGTDDLSRMVSRRRCLAAIAALAALALLPATASAGLSSVADNDWVTNGPVAALARSGNTLYLGGKFSEVGPPTGPVVAFSGGSATPDGAFPQVSGGHAEVRAAIPDGSGGWYLGGNFTHVGGSPRAGLAHVLADGSIDPNFAPSLEINQNTWSVDALALSGSTLFVGGSFRTISGVSRNGLAAITTTDGSVQTWNPAPNSGGVAVEALAISGGILYVGGSFGELEDQSRANLGAFDITSKSLTAWAPSTSGTNPNVKALVVSGSTIYLAGFFDHVGGQARSGFAAVDTSGNLAAWSPEASGCGAASGLALAAAGPVIYLGGCFSHIGGQSRVGLAALDPTTAAATSWNPGVSPSTSAVTTVAVSGSSVYAGGTFSQIGGQARNGLGAVDSSTAIATSWDPHPNDTNGVSGFAFGNQVDLVAAAGTQVVAGGAFTSVGGVTRNNLAAIDLSTGKATEWNPNLTPSFPLMTLPVYAMSAAGGVVYVGGSFSSVGGQARTDLAALDPTTGAATSWNPGATSVFPENGHVTALLASDTSVYVGGSFTSLAGSSEHYLGAISASSGAATSWSPLVTAPGSATEHGASPVAALALAGSTVYVGGNFTGLGGQTRTGLAALDSETGGASSWNPVLSGIGGIAPNVTSLAPAGGMIYATGPLGPVAIDAASGAVTSLNRLSAPLAVAQSALYLGASALDLESGLALPWSPASVGFNAGVTSVLAAGDRVVLGGGFTTTDQAPASGVAVYSFVGPVSSAAPTITGTAAQGQTLTAHHGNWSPAPTSFGLQWLRCLHGSPYPPPCTPIAGATASTYVPTSGDAGMTIEVQETASDAEGSSDPVGSLPTAAVLAPPAGLSPPQVSGTPAVGQTLSCSTGTWSNAPTSYAYQWRRDFIEPIAGASSPAYTIASADVGHELACQVTATNAAGSTPAVGFAPSIEASGEPKPPPPAPSPKGATETLSLGASISTGGSSVIAPAVTGVPSPTSGPSAALVAAALKAAVGARSARVSAGKLLASGYGLSFNAPAPGTLAIVWTAMTTKASRAAMPVTVASATKRLTAGGRAVVTIHLTKAGRTLVKASKAQHVNELASFTPVQGGVQTARQTVTIMARRSR
jgi:hypothetical protein